MKQRAVKMPDDLWAGVQSEAAKLGLTAGEFVRLAVEEKVRLPEPEIVEEVHRTTPAQIASLSALPASGARVISASTAETRIYRCPRDCNPTWRPTSKAIRCPVCRAETIPV